jgi:hypothetical protein
LAGSALMRGKVPLLSVNWMKGGEYVELVLTTTKNGHVDGSPSHRSLDLHQHRDTLDFSHWIGVVNANETIYFRDDSFGITLEYLSGKYSIDV